MYNKKRAGELRGEGRGERGGKVDGQTCRNMSIRCFCSGCFFVAETLGGGGGRGSGEGGG